LALGAVLLAPLAGTADAATAHARAAGVVQPAAYSPATTISRAKTWLTAVDGHQVPYSQTATHGGYRTDCSGYVSMALELAKPGPNTVSLATSTYTTKITMAKLKQGDLIIDSTGTADTRHVVIFDKWTSTAHTKYWAYEQAGGIGTEHDIESYGVGADQYNPYRPNKY
jgi:cell wall-associated NlpC family hydrolase